MNDATHDRTSPSPAGADGDLGYLLTAYADGQLALEGMAWVEEQLDRRPELRARLKEIRAVQAALRAEFARFPAPAELGGFARGQVLAAARRGPPPARRRWALAALVVIGVSASVMAVMVTMGRPRLIEQLGAQAAPEAAPAAALAFLGDQARQDGDAPAPVGAVASGDEDSRDQGFVQQQATRSSVEPLARADDRVAEAPSQRQAAALKPKEETQDRQRVSLRGEVEGFAVGGKEVQSTDRLAAAPSIPAAAKPPPGARGAGGGLWLSRAAPSPVAPSPVPPGFAADRLEAAAVNGAADTATVQPPVPAVGGVVGYSTPVVAARLPQSAADDRGSADKPLALPVERRADAALAHTEGGRGGADRAFRAAPPAQPQEPPASAADGIAGRSVAVANAPDAAFTGAVTAPSAGQPVSNMPAPTKPSAGGEPGREPAKQDDSDGRIIRIEQELARSPAPEVQMELRKRLVEERRSRHVYLRQIKDPASPEGGGVVAGDERSATAKRVSEEIHRSLVPQSELMVYDGTAQQGGGEQKKAGSSANTAADTWNQEHRMISESKAGDRLSDLTILTPVMKFSNPSPDAQREQDLSKLVKDDDDKVAQLAIVKERYPKVFNDVSDETVRTAMMPQLDIVNHSRNWELAATPPGSDGTTPSQRLSSGNAQRAPRDRVAALLATTSVNATAPLATMLRTAAGPDGALAASPALDEVLARPAHLEAHDLPSGQALLQLARGAGLQARVLGGVLTLDAARGQLDPTDTQGLDRATFTKAFGTVPMLATADDARSTFALDANTASFERARAQLRGGELPDPAAIQAEHFINAMPMDYPAARGPEAFALYAEAAPSPFAVGAADAAARAPWAGRTAVVAVGAVARPAAPDERRPLRLTLALDCSGSMAQPGGLDRVRLGLEELLTHLRPVDTVAVVAFSDQARVVLPATPGGDPAPIARALAGLVPGGATNAVEGLALAYQLAAEHLEPGSENRVLFATDGGTLAGADAQVVVERVTAYKSRGISLLVVGCGGGAYQGRTLQQLADRADGQHVFLGSDAEAVSAFSSRLLPERLAVLAKDAKVQVTWNPQRVSHFRLIGYEQRRLAHQDFRNDAVDAGEISHDTQVTALYEVLLVDGATGPLGSAAVRYFDTRLQQVRELSCPLAGAVLQAEPSQRLRLVACAAEFAAWLQRGWWSNVRPTTPARLLGELARCPQGEARELEELVQRAAALQPQPVPLINGAPNQAIPKP